MLRILTAENTTFNMNDVPDQISPSAVQYCVLDYSDPDDVDYHWLPLVYLESFTSPAVDLRIGSYRIQIPLDWSIVIGEKDLGDIEVLSLMSLNDREFNAYCFNPFSSYMPEFLPIEIANVYPDVKWHVPRLKNGNILAVPLIDCITPPTKEPNGRWLEPGPQVAYFVQAASRLPEQLDIRKLF